MGAKKLSNGKCIANTAIVLIIKGQNISKKEILVNARRITNITRNYLGKDNYVHLAIREDLKLDKEFILGIDIPAEIIPQGVSTKNFLKNLSEKLTFVYTKNSSFELDSPIEIGTELELAMKN